MGDIYKHSIMATVTLLTITACRNIRGQLNCTGLSPGHVFIPGPSDRHFKIQYCQVSVDVLNVQNSPMRNCFIQANFFLLNLMSEGLAILGFYQADRL